MTKFSTNGIPTYVVGGTIDPSSPKFSTFIVLSGVSNLTAWLCKPLPRSLATRTNHRPVTARVVESGEPDNTPATGVWSFPLFEDTVIDGSVYLVFSGSQNADCVLEYVSPPSDMKVRYVYGYPAKPSAPISWGDGELVTVYSVVNNSTRELTVTKFSVDGIKIYAPDHGPSNKWTYIVLSGVISGVTNVWPRYCVPRSASTTD